MMKSDNADPCTRALRNGDAAVGPYEDAVGKLHNGSLIYWRSATAARIEYEKERQVAPCRNYVLRLGSTPVGVFGDCGVSGLTMDRPGVRALMADALRGDARRVVVWDLARVSRDVAALMRFHADLTAMGIELHSIEHGRIDLGAVAVLGYLGAFAHRRYGNETDGASLSCVGASICGRRWPS